MLSSLRLLYPIGASMGVTLLVQRDSSALDLRNSAMSMIPPLPGLDSATPT